MWAIRPYVLRCTGADPLADAWEELGMMRVQWDGDMPVFDYRNLMTV